MTGRRGGSVQRCVAASSPERGSAATPGGAREDERGEGGSKTGNGSGLVGLTVGGGGWKHVGEGRSGSVAGVNERRLAWPCAEESKGGKEKRAQRGIGSFEAEAGEAGER
jgi:hypothetical protein